MVDRWHSFTDAEVVDRAVNMLATRYQLFESEKDSKVAKAAYKLAEIARERGVRPSELSAEDLGLSDSLLEFTKSEIVKKAVRYRP